MALYGITAEELHAIIIEDLRHHCEHWNINLLPHVFDNEQGRPLEQTIGMILTVALLQEPPK